MTKILSIDKSDPQSALLEQARNVLAAGGLVIVPTETVYGIACDPSVPDSMDKLIAAKGRAGDKPIARLASNAEQVEKSSKNWTSCS